MLQQLSVSSFSLCSLLCSQRLQLQPQAALGPQDELGEAADASGAGAQVRVHPRGQAEPEEGQRHDDPQLCQGELLTDAVPVSTHTHMNVLAVSGLIC